MNNPTPVHHVRSLSALLGHVPALLGYMPKESVVILPMREGRTVGAMRLDLPTTDNLTEVATTIATLVSQVPGVTAVIAVTYDSAKEYTLIQWLDSALQVHGIELTEAAYVTTATWASYLHPDQCGLTSELPDSGIAVAASQHIPDLPTIDPSLVGTTPSENLDEIIAALDAMERWLTQPEDKPLRYVSISTLAAIMDRPSLRDIFLIQAVSDEATGAEAMDAQMDWQLGEEYPAHLAAFVHGEAQVKPDGDRIKRALHMTRQVLAATPSAGAWSLAAWFSWALGLSTHADEYAAKGLEMEPGHGLCEIIQAFTAAGHLPGWAFTR